MGWAEWIRTVEIEPSIDATRAGVLERHVEALLRTGCRVFHVNGSGNEVRAAVDVLTPLMRRYDGLFDVHVSDGDLVDLGADSVTFDASAVSDVAGAIETLHAAGLQAGVAFDDSVSAEEIAQAAAGADLVLCMCNGHFPAKHVRSVSVALPARVALQVEGEVTHENLRSLYDAGARLFVTDRPIFEREDLPRAYRRLVQALA
jgi:pentose-5-phosphate-3-epimerase